MEKKEKVPRKRQNKYKIRFTISMDLHDGISSSASKGPNKVVSEEDIDDFLKHTRSLLDELEADWKKLYHPKEEKKYEHRI